MLRLPSALRPVFRNKEFTTINIAGLSLALVAAITIVLFVATHYETDRHHPDFNRIFRVVLDIHAAGNQTEHHAGTALPLGRALADQFGQIEQAAFCMEFYNAPTLTVQQNGTPVRFRENDMVAYADSRFISMFAYDFVSGNKATALNDPGSVVISEQQALKYFGTTEALGRLININHSIDLFVTGVFDRSQNRTDLDHQVLVSLPTLKVINPTYQDHNLSWIGSNNWTFLKLIDEQASATIDNALPAFVQKHLGPEFNHWQLRLQPLTAMHSDTRYTGVISPLLLWMLTGAAILIIAMAGINYVNLTNAQAQDRAKEIGIRKCLGSSRARLFSSLMIETAMLVMLSFGVAIIAVNALLPLVNTWLHETLTMTGLLHPKAILCLLTLVTILVIAAGYYPAVKLSGYSPIAAIQRQKIAGSEGAFGKMLIVFQYALAFIFLISTLVIVLQFDLLLGKDPGFTSKSIVSVKLPRKAATTWRAFQQQVDGLSSVKSSTLHHQAPMGALLDGGFIRFDNRTDSEPFFVRDRWADDNYIATFDLHLIAGRNFNSNDSIPGVIVNESFVRKLGIEQPELVLERPVYLDNALLNGVIVGVVRDFHNRSLQNDIEPVAIYTFPAAYKSLSIQLAGSDRHALLAALNSYWNKHYPDEIFEYTFLDDHLAAMYNTEKSARNFMIIFSFIAAFTGLMGIVGISAYTISRRMKEFAIRKVLGASTEVITGMICKQYVLLFLTAFALAVPAAYVISNRWLQDFAYRIELKWIVFAAPPAALVTVALAVICVQLVRSLLINPVSHLRAQ